jgi:hypothetical protein
MENIHIGKIICDRLKAEGRSKKWLAEQVNVHHSCLGKSLKNSHINTNLLFSISLALNHNFFEDYTTVFDEANNNHQQ